MFHRCVLCVLLAALAVVPLAAAEQALTADQVVAKNLEARGGAAKIKAVESARVSGKMDIGGGAQAPVQFEWKKPNKVRMEFTFQGMTGVNAYDGTAGWQVMPFMGKTEPEPMSSDDIKMIEDQADFLGPLVDWKEKGHQVEYLGQEEHEGTPVHKLKVTKKSGDVDTLYLDAEYFLEIKQEGKRTMRGQEMSIATTVGDYKEVDGLMFAHSFTSQIQGMPSGQTVTIETIELNVPIADSRFAMPAPKEETKPDDGSN